MDVTLQVKAAFIKTTKENRRDLCHAPIGAKY